MSCREDAIEANQGLMTLPPLPKDARCCCMRSSDADLTGERAIECGAPAVVECEYCGPMCSVCREETFCIFSVHTVVAVAAVTHTTDEHDRAVGA